MSQIGQPEEIWEVDPVPVPIEVPEQQPDEVPEEAPVEVG